MRKSLVRTCVLLFNTYVRTHSQINRCKCARCCTLTKLSTKNSNADFRLRLIYLKINNQLYFIRREKYSCEDEENGRETTEKKCHPKKSTTTARAAAATTTIKPENHQINQLFKWMI